MAVNKNFVVKNGLEVNENLIVANATDGFVGVGTSTPNEVLHVFGGIGATDVRVTGISSFIQNVYVGASGTTFSVVDITGSLPAVGVGTDQPEYLLDVRGPVSTGYTSLYVQGDVRITGDIIADDLVFDQGNFTNLEVSGITTTSSLVVGFGASLAGISTLNRLNVTGDTNITGVTTLASAGGITTTGGDLWVGSNFYVSGTQTIDSDLYIIGIATVGILSATDAVVSGASTVNGNFTVGGDATVIGDLNVTGDITYDEVSGRNLNITGIATIHTLGVTSTTTTTDLKVSAGATVDGASTLTGHVSLGTTVGAAGSIYFPDGKGINFGDAAEGDLSIYHTSDVSYIDHDGTGYLFIHADNFAVRSVAQENYIVANTNEGVDLYFDNTKRFETTNTGVYITGIGTASSAFDVGSTIKMDGPSGVITATTFSGVGEVIGIGSEGTPIGTGVSFIDFRSTNGAGVSCQPAVNGIATVTVTPGVSLGLAIALGG